MLNSALPLSATALPVCLTNTDTSPVILLSSSVAVRAGARSQARAARGDTNRPFTSQVTAPLQGLAEWRSGTGNMVSHPLCSAWKNRSCCKPLCTPEEPSTGARGRCWLCLGELAVGMSCCCDAAAVGGSAGQGRAAGQELDPGWGRALLLMGTKWPHWLRSPMP